MSASCFGADEIEAATRVLALRTSGVDGVEVIVPPPDVVSFRWRLRVVVREITRVDELGSASRGSWP